MVAVAPARAARPGATATAGNDVESCPFCAGHEDRTPPETLRLGDPWQVRVVPNLYPALERQEVVVHTPRHVRSLAELTNEELALVADAWRLRAEAVPGYVHASVNEGREAGSSLPHTHSQLSWLPFEPGPEPPREGETILERGGLVAWCPYVARLPYESAIGPSEPEPDGLRSALLAPALQLLAELVRRLHRLEGQAPLNAWLHNHASGWRIVLLPRLSVLAGLELGAGIYVNTLAPEQAAKALRAAK